ncbi:MAG: GTP-binding protein [Candidatus Lokiarchaeota archaeon]|nr:GTP-binding protein [Candidatus Lokiarchaeota archaeon]
MKHCNKNVMKILIVGNGGVGKSSLLHRIVKNKFCADMDITIGIDFLVYEADYNGQHYLLQLWDFSGQERFRFILDSYVAGSSGVMLLFDLTRPETIDEIDEWVQIARKTDRNIPILLVGTKNDRHVETNLNEDLIEYKMKEFALFDFVKTSAKTGNKAEDGLMLLFKKILALRNANSEDGENLQVLMQM